jgi:hypothetical protein
MVAPSANRNPLSSMTDSKRLTTCVVGGGNSAHILIPILALAGQQVNLLTRRPEDWNDDIYCQVTDGVSEKVQQTYVGKLTKKSSDPSQVIPEADIIILCLPVHQYHPALDRIAPHINADKEVYVGTIFGQGGFNWMVNDIKTRYKLNKVTTFVVGSIPWICRTIEYGKIGESYGTKDVNLVAVSPMEKFHRLEEILLDDLSMKPFGRGKFRLASSFIELILSVDNQIIHPARCYGLWKKSQGGAWPNSKDVPYFYRDFDFESAEILRKLDDDYTVVRNAVQKRFPDRKFPHMLSYLELERLNHGSKNADILASLRDSVQLASIKTPVVEKDGMWKLNTDCRFFTDDIAYGIVIAKWIAEELNVKTPFIDEIIGWAQSLRGEHFLDENDKLDRDFCLHQKYISGIPEAYGISSVEDILD